LCTVVFGQLRVAPQNPKTPVEKIIINSTGVHCLSHEDLLDLVD